MDDNGRTNEEWNAKRKVDSKIKTLELMTVNKEKQTHQDQHVAKDSSVEVLSPATDQGIGRDTGESSWTEVMSKNNIKKDAIAL